MRVASIRPRISQQKPNAMQSILLNSFYLSDKIPPASEILSEINRIEALKLCDQELFITRSSRQLNIAKLIKGSALASKPRCVLVQVVALSTNFRDRGDLELRMINPAISRYFIGSDFVGRIVAIGSDVGELQIGDRVIPSHAYPDNGLVSVTASAGLLLIDSSRLLKIPDKITDPIAASFSVPYQTAYSLVRRSGVTESCSHAIVTAPRSATSIAIMQILGALDIPFSVISRSELDEKSFGGLRAQRIIVVDPLKASFSDELRGSLSTLDVSHVFDNFPDVYAYSLVPYLSHESVYMFAGLLDQGELFQEKSGHAILFSQIIQRLMMKNIRFVGNCLGTDSDLVMALDLLLGSRINASVDSIYPYDQIGCFLKRSFESPSRIGKCVLVLSNVTK